MSRLTWREVDEYLERRDDVLVPLGSVEEHGYHLPLGTDTFIVRRLAERVGEETGTLVTPPIWYGVCIHTAAYPGTITLTTDALGSIAVSLLHDLARQGFRKLYLITGHAGKTQLAVLKEAGRRVMAEKDVKVHLINPYEIDISDILESYALHAGEAETSLMLDLMPELVDTKKAVGGELKRKKFTVDSPFVRYTDSGVFGRPELASKEKGRRIFERWVEEIANFIRSESK